MQIQFEDDGKTVCLAEVVRRSYHIFVFGLGMRGEPRYGGQHCSAKSRVSAWVLLFDLQGFSGEIMSLMIPKWMGER
jgi:hypothetical protein